MGNFVGGKPEINGNHDRTPGCDSAHERKELRIVKLNDFFIEAIPEGYILLVNNDDRPGVIGNIGNALGSQNINIATMQFGRDQMGGHAISLLHLDSPLPPGGVGEILRLPNIISVRQIQL